MIQFGPFASALPSEDDEEIVGLFFSRDESAIHRTSEKYGRYLTSVSLNILKDAGEAEECVNDAYYRAWQTIPPERPGSLCAYLAKITRNISLDRYRARFAGKRAEGEYAVSLDELAESISDGEEMSPEKVLDRRALADHISRFLREQKKFARQVFVCRYFYAESVRDIARRFSVGESMVKTSLLRTRKKLKEYLKKEGYLV